jgi:hypothetical protein
MTWTERYLAAVLRSIPEPKRTDVERELRSSIDDAIEERVSTGEARAAAERLVLEGLGDPSELAGAYTGRPSYLIGPELFPLYRRIVPRLLLVAVPIAGVVILTLTVAGGGGPVAALAAGITGAIGVGSQIAFWASLAFVLLEWAGPARQARADIIATAGRWTLERLPKVQTGRIPIGETSGEIITVVITLGVLVFVAGLSTTNGAGRIIPLLAPSFVWPWLALLLILLGVRAFAHIVAYNHGRWTGWLAAYLIVAQLVFGAIVVSRALGGGIVNQEFADLIDPGLTRGYGPIMVLVAAGTILATGWEVVRVLLRVRRARGATQLLDASPASLPTLSGRPDQ